MAKSLLLKNVISVDKGVLMIDTTNNCIFELTDIDCPDNIRLSPQEKRVMRGLAKGMNNEQIALMLHVSPRTVTTYREKVRRKVWLSVDRGGDVPCDKFRIVGRGEGMKCPRCADGRNDNICFPCRCTLCYGEGDVNFWRGMWELKWEWLWLPIAILITTVLIIM